MSHALGRTTLLRADAGLQREALDSAGNSWREQSISLTAVRELPRGFIVSAGPSHRWRRYEAPIPTFGPDRRLDRTLAGQIRALNRRIELFGFTPEITLRHERRSSNIDLYDYERTAGEVRFVRLF